MWAVLVACAEVVEGDAGRPSETGDTGVGDTTGDTGEPLPDLISAWGADCIEVTDPTQYGATDSKHVATIWADVLGADSGTVSITGLGDYPYAPAEDLRENHAMLATASGVQVELETDWPPGYATPDVSSVFTCNQFNAELLTFVVRAYRADGSRIDCIAWGYDVAGLPDLEVTGCRVL